MEFDKQIPDSHQLGPLCDKFQSMCMSILKQVVEFYDTVMKKSWNFVAKISWQPCSGLKKTDYPIVRDK